MERKSMMLRLDGELAEQLELVAAADGQSMSDVIRRAIAEHIEQRRRDPAFRASVRTMLARHQRLLEGLAEDDG